MVAARLSENGMSEVGRRLGPPKKKFRMKEGQKVSGNEGRPGRGHEGAKQRQMHKGME